MTRLGAALFAALAAAAALAAQPAAATPTIAEALSFARSEINRLCDSQELSWFDEIDEQPVRRSCRALITRNALTLRVSYSYAAPGDEGRLEADRPALRMAATGEAAAPDPATIHAGRSVMEIQFAPQSRYVCGPPRRNGYAPLYLNCVGETSLSDASCVIERHERWSTDGGRHVDRRVRPFGLLFSARPDDCRRIRNALNFVAERAPTPPKREVFDFFSEN